MKYYLIHGIDSSRKPFMKEQFQKYGITDVMWITSPNKNDYLPEGICSNTTMSRGHISCTYKHYLILKDIVENQYPIAVIMEDNIEFQNNVPETIERYLKDLPINWDCVFDSDYFGWKYIEGTINETISVYKKSNTATLQNKGSSKGAHFIVMNLKCATKLYENFIPFHEGSDHMYNEIFRKFDMNVYWAEPPNVHKIQRESTWIDIPPPKQKQFSWLQISKIK